MATTTDVASNMVTDNSNNTPSKIIKLQSKDGQIYEVDEAVTEQLSAIKTLLDSMFICS
jgi:hypothetical protein